MQKLVWTAALLSLISLSADATERSLCFRLSMSGPEAESEEHARSETWCYQHPAELGGSVLFIYNADQEEARPELAMLVEKDGTITHGSLMNDELSIHRSRGGFNPYNVPLAEPEGGRAVGPGEEKASAASVRATLATLAAHRGEMAVSSGAELSTGESLASGSAAFKPWRGYWWPQKGATLASGPLARFDAYVKTQTGSNPGSAAYERSHHGYSGVWWSGHCNGWAASSVLRNEPRVSRTGSGITFSVSDLKGLLAETDYCAAVAFFGSRNRGGGNNGDIRPHLFHKTLRYYIGSLRKPVAMDYRSDEAVDNHVISAYSMNMEPTGPDTFRVTTVLTVHKYDLSKTNNPGIAPAYSRTYKYNLRVDSNGNAVGGSWISGNPDFLWVPLSPKDCSSNNARLSREWVSKILSM